MHGKTLLGNGSVLAKGGSISGIGGFGGGGRIKVNLTEWFQGASGSGLLVDVSSGQQGEINWEKRASRLRPAGTSGSVMVSPCLPGFETDGGGGCRKCPAGYYKMLLGPSSCRRCLNNGKESRFEFPTDDIQATPLCRVKGCRRPFHLVGG